MIKDTSLQFFPFFSKTPRNFPLLKGPRPHPLFQKKTPECSLGELVPRLFKIFLSIENHGSQGMGLIFLIWYKAYLVTSLKTIEGLVNQVSKSSCLQILVRFENNLAQIECILIDLYQICALSF